MGLFDKFAGAASFGIVGEDPYGGAFTDFIPGIGDAKAQERANQANIAEAAKNREFQERMSSTAYQRAMADMRIAGLNPTLAYMQGGASAPSGSQATVQAASKTRLADIALKATTGLGGLSQQATALQQQNTMNESSIQLQSANAAKAVAETEKTRAETSGIGKKEEEGKLWKKFYKGINNILDHSGKGMKENHDRMEKLLNKKVRPKAKEFFGRIPKPH